MNCTTFRELAHEFAEGVLPPETAEPARLHAAECAECAERVEAARKFDRFLAEEGDAALESWSSHQAALTALTDPSPAPPRVLEPPAPAPMRVLSRRRPSSIWRMAPFAGVAAASALFVAIAYSFLSGPEVLAEGRSADLARGEHVLACEGRDLEAVDAARVMVPVGSGGKVVRLESGTVLFSVEPGRAFSVETPQGTASALGTSFHVEVTSGRQVSVSVLSGKVSFRAVRETTLLGAGDRLEVDASGVQRLISRRRLDDLQADLAKTREDAAGMRREHDTRPGAVDPQPAPAPTADTVAEAVRTYLSSEAGRQALADAAKAANDESVARAASHMFDEMISRFAKTADLTEDQTRRLREIFRRSGAEFRDAWKPLHSIAADATDAERDRVRREVAAKSVEIEQRKIDEVKILLSQTQFERFQKAFPPMPPGFGDGTRGN